MGMFDRGEIMGWCFLIMGLASCTGSIARARVCVCVLWCSFYWPFFSDYSLLAFSKAPANGNLFMGWIQEVFSSDIEILFCLNFKLGRDHRKHDDTIECLDQIQNLKFILGLVIVNKLCDSLAWQKSKRDDAMTTKDQRDKLISFREPSVSSQIFLSSSNSPEIWT